MTFSAVDADRAQRSAALVDAARRLAEATGSAAFTVAQVAREAGCSLKGFYGCFASKDELLLALLRHDSQRGAALVGARLGLAAPGEQVDAFVEMMFEMVEYPETRAYASLLLREHRRLEEVRPQEMRETLAPLHEVLHEACDPADARAVFTLVLAGIGDVILGGADAESTAAEIAAFCRRGVRPR